MSISPGRRAESARFGYAQAIARCGEPLQFQWWVRVFEPQLQPTSPLLRGDGHLLDCGMVEECP